MDFGNKSVSNNTEYLCVGSISEKINAIIANYTTLKKVFNNFAQKLNEMNEQNKHQDFNSIPSCEMVQNYFILIKTMRNQINDTLKNQKSDENEDNLISKKERNIKIRFSDREFEINFIPFNGLYFVQKTDSDGELLYFSKNPNKTPYENNSKIVYEVLMDKKNIYPVWYFNYNNKVSPNYEFIINLMNNPNLRYDDILKDRLVVNKFVTSPNKRTVNAYGKYNFNYIPDKSLLNLNNPKNKYMSLSPHLQGVFDGFYSFEDDLINYTSLGQVNIVLFNTIKVIEQLINFLDLYISDLIQQRDNILLMAKQRSY